MKKFPIFVKKLTNFKQLYSYIKQNTMLKLLRTVGRNEIPWGIVIFLIGFCLFSVGLDLDFVSETPGLRIVMTLVGVASLSLLTASYTLYVVEFSLFGYKKELPDDHPNTEYI